MAQEKLWYVAASDGNTNEFTSKTTMYYQLVPISEKQAGLLKKLQIQIKIGQNALKGEFPDGPPKNLGDRSKDESAERYMQRREALIGTYESKRLEILYEPRGRPKGSAYTLSVTFPSPKPEPFEVGSVVRQSQIDKLANKKMEPLEPAATKKVKR
jgi:hypothetical protein